MAKDTLSLTGQTIQNIRFDAIVDEGGFGWVYRGRHLGLDEPVAIKCLKVQAAALELGSFEGRFRDETKIAYRLSQGSLDIVRSISSGTLTTPAGMVVPFMVLEWLDGRTLAVELTARRKNGLPPFTLDAMLTLMGSAAKALAHAHAQGVIHRDVKPSNLFVAETRDGRRVKVLDFGLAKILDPDTFMTPEAAPTASHVFVCSPAYGAPEQFSKEIGALSPATDVYSFALVLLEMLSGKKVRESSTLMEGMLRAVDPRFSSPKASELGIVVRAPVEHVLARALAFDPRDRHRDAGELWDALTEAATAPEVSGPTLVEDAPAGAREALELARRRGDAFQAAGGASLGKGGTLAMSPAARPDADTTAPMPQAPRLPEKVRVADGDSEPRLVSAAPARTLPLDAKRPDHPLTKTAPLERSPLAQRGLDPNPAVAPRVSTTSSPPPPPPMPKAMWPWFLAAMVLAAFAGVATAVWRARHAR